MHTLSSYPGRLGVDCAKKMEKEHKDAQTMEWKGLFSGMASGDDVSRMATSTQVGAHCVDMGGKGADGLAASSRKPVRRGSEVEGAHSCTAIPPYPGPMTPNVSPPLLGRSVPRERRSAWPSRASRRRASSYSTAGAGGELTNRFAHRFHC